MDGRKGAAQVARHGWTGGLVWMEGKWMDGRVSSKEGGAGEAAPPPPPPPKMKFLDDTLDGWPGVGGGKVCGWVAVCQYYLRCINIILGIY